MNKNFPNSNPRDFALANHVRAAAWARESRTRAMVARFTDTDSRVDHLDRSRWAAKVAREWWTRFLAA